jgi:hypothetical protein
MNPSLVVICAAWTDWIIVREAASKYMEKTRHRSSEMAEHFDRALDAADLIGPAFGALVFIALMSVVPEPARQRFNAIFVAGAGAAYSTADSEGVVYIGIATLIAYQGLSRYRYIGLAWFFHAGWDVIHHLNASPI